MSNIREHPEAFFDSEGHFMHKCWCGKEGVFGYGVSLRQGKLGKHYCSEHWPDRPPPALTEPTKPPPGPPGLQALVAQFGGYDKITPEAWAEWDRVTEQYRDDIRNSRPAPQTRAEAAE